MGVLLVDAVVRGVIPAGYDVSLYAGGIVQEEVGDGGTVWHKARADVGS